MGTYDEKIKNASPPHTLSLEGRERLTVSGVEDVESFDESSVVMYTNKGALAVHGRELRMERLSLDGGELRLEGYIDSLAYEDESSSGGFWSRLFR